MRKLPKNMVLGDGTTDELWNGGREACIMNAVAYIAGEDAETDHPDCADPDITTLAIAINDSFNSDRARNALKPYISRIVGTRSTWAWVSLARRYAAAKVFHLIDPKGGYRQPRDIAANEYEFNDAVGDLECWMNSRQHSKRAKLALTALDAMLAIKSPEQIKRREQGYGILLPLPTTCPLETVHA